MPPHSPSNYHFHAGNGGGVSSPPCPYDFRLRPGSEPPPFIMFGCWRMAAFHVPQKDDNPISSMAGASRRPRTPTTSGLGPEAGRLLSLCWAAGAWPHRVSTSRAGAREARAHTINSNPTRYLVMTWLLFPLLIIFGLALHDYTRRNMRR